MLLMWSTSKCKSYENLANDEMWIDVKYPNGKCY